MAAAISVQPFQMNSVASFRFRSANAPASKAPRARSTIVPAASSRATVQSSAKRLLEILTTSAGSNKEVSQLVDDVSSAGNPFNESLLGGGPWVVRYTKGKPQWWNITYQPTKMLQPTNTASQDLDPKSRAVTNRAEYSGGNLYVTASGGYAPRDASTKTPKVIDVQVGSGVLHVAGVNLPLPIRGKGTFEVCYLDSNLRVFRSGNSYSVQIRADYLDKVQGLGAK